MEILNLLDICFWHSESHKSLTLLLNLRFKFVKYALFQNGTLIFQADNNLYMIEGCENLKINLLVLDNGNDFTRGEIGPSCDVLQC